MTTRRERLENQAARRRDWAGSRAGKADAAHRRSAEVVEGPRSESQSIPGGQHGRSGGLHQQSGDAALAAVEHERMAVVHGGKAGTIERQLYESVYADDPDAIERLEKKLAELEIQREPWKEENAAYRRKHRDALKQMDEFQRDQVVPHPKYELSNLAGVITTTRKRIEKLKREQEEGAPDPFALATGALQPVDALLDSRTNTF